MKVVNTKTSRILYRAAATVMRGFEAVVPKPKLGLMDQVREVLRPKHCAIRAVEEHAF